MHKLALKSFGKTHIYNPSDITHISSSGRKVFVHTAEGSSGFYGRLQDLQSQLPENFVRCHKCYCVNLDYIATASGVKVTLLDSTALPVGRSFKDGFEASLSHFLAVR